jgi:ribA/ribD-fused uncharacterized protein
MDIASFQGEHRYLSNFWPARVIHDGLVFDYSENAFQAAKRDILTERAEFKRLHPRDAKRKGHERPVGPTWDRDRLLTMFHVVNDKFGAPDLWDRLSHTRGSTLVEGNTWGDRFWGTVGGVGENWLGRILMYVRDRPPVVLVCGGRDYANAARMDEMLSQIPKPFVLRHGAARGADTLAGAWATRVGVFVEPYPAPWRLYDSPGKNIAGFIRNAAMIRGPRIARCIAFPGGNGTADMVKSCEKAGIPVTLVGDHP